MLGADALRGQGAPAAAGPLGHVQSVSGSQVSIGLVGRQHGAGMTVGKFVKIESGQALIVGVIADVAVQPVAAKEQDLQGMARVDLMGEIDGRDGGPIRFRRGVTTYPTIGDPVAPLSEVNPTAQTRNLPIPASKDARVPSPPRIPLNLACASYNRYNARLPGRALTPVQPGPAQGLPL